MGNDDERPRGVTSALLNAKMDTVIEMLAEFKVELGEHDDRIRALETESAGLKERVNLFGAALIVGQLLGSSIAAYIGAIR